MQKLKSYLKDNKDFIKKAEAIDNVSDDFYFVPVDVSSLYINTPHKEWIEAVKQRLQKLTLTLNNFVFNWKKSPEKKVVLWVQNMLLAMQMFLWFGLKKSSFPSLTNLSNSYLCFIDNIFLIWNGTKIQDFLKKSVNVIQPSDQNMRYQNQKSIFSTSQLLE